MIDKDCIEEAYCFIHQKWRVYKFSSNPRQKEDIEYAISQYVESMNKALYTLISNGKPNFLVDYTSFAEDMQAAESRLETMLTNLS